MFYADAALDAGARLELSPEREEQALYVVEGRVAIAGSALEVFPEAVVVAYRAMTSAITGGTNATRTPLPALR